MQIYLSRLFDIVRYANNSVCHPINVLLERPYLYSPQRVLESARWYSDLQRSGYSMSGDDSASLEH